MSEVSITDKLKGLGQTIQQEEVKQVEERTMTLEEYQNLLKSIRPEDKIKLTFQQTAGQYWGKIGKVRVLGTKETEKGTRYFIVVADIIKNGEKMKLIQEWFIGQDGLAKPAPKKNITIPDDYADEAALLISDTFECK